MADLPHVAKGGPHVAAHNDERDAINGLPKFEDLFFRTSVRNLPDNDAYLAGTGVYAITEETLNLGDLITQGADFTNGAIMYSANHGGEEGFGSQMLIVPVSSQTIAIFLRMCFLDTWTPWTQFNSV